MYKEHVGDAQRTALDHASGYGSHRMLGDGAFGVVYSDGNRAYKLLRVRGSDAYLKYAAAVMQDANPWFPRIESCVTYDDGAEEFAVVTMELLCAGSTALEYGLRQSVADMVRTVVDAVEHGAMSDEYIVDRVQHGSLIRDRGQAASVLRAAKLILRIAQEVQPASPLERLDIHGNNLMQRRDGAFVLTDPLAF